MIHVTRDVAPTFAIGGTTATGHCMLATPGTPFQLRVPGGEPSVPRWAA